MTSMSFFFRFLPLMLIRLQLLTFKHTATTTSIFVPVRVIVHSFPQVSRLVEYNSDLLS